jgi:hypothetical protein
MTHCYRSLLALIAGSLIACGGDAPELVLAQADFPAFQSQVYPVLLRDCSFFACHGSTERFFQVYGPGRARLDPMTKPLDALTMDELIQSYNRALSMIDVQAPAQSQLLRKPLSLSAGGTGHEGVDAWMRDVYVSKQDPSYAAIEAWVLAATAAVPAPAPAPTGATP